LLKRNEFPAQGEKTGAPFLLDPFSVEAILCVGNSNQ